MQAGLLPCMCGDVALGLETIHIPPCWFERICSRANRRFITPAGKACSGVKGFHGGMLSWFANSRNLI